MTDFAAASEAKKGLQFDIHTALVALRCWWPVALPIGLVLGCIAAGAICLLHKPMYTASASLMIKEKPDVVLREVGNDARRFIQNQMEIIRSPRLLAPLAANPEIAAAPEFEQEFDIAAALAKRIQIRSHGDSDFYDVSYASESPEKAEIIVREVVDAYLAFTRRMESEQTSRIIKLLEEQRAARYEEMSQLRESVRVLSMQLTGVDPFRAATTVAEANKLANPMVGLQAEILREEVAQDVREAHLRAEVQTTSNDDVDVSQLEVQKEIEAQPRYVAMRERVEQLRKREVDFVKTAKNRDANPQFKQIKADLAAEETALNDLKASLHADIRESLALRAGMERTERMKSLKSEFAKGEAHLQILRNRMKEGLGTAKQFTGDSLGLEFRKAKLDQVTKIHDEISARILAITTEQRAPDRIMLTKEVTLPVVPNERIPLNKMILGFVALGAIPFALAIGWEHLFKRVSNRGQIEMSNKISIVGEVASLPAKARASSRGAPVGREMMLFKESVDSLRTYLCLSEMLKSARTLAITSAVSREGKTSLSSQLAVSIAAASEGLTLIIDGDMRAPDVHRIFELPEGPGLAEVLSGECTFEAAIRATKHPNLFVLPAGRLAASPHRLLGNNAFKSLLESLKPKYQRIVLDTPPILPASEALVLARACDAAMLCMRRDFSRVDQVQDAYDRMINAGVKTAGAVLNGIPVRHYAYKYGCYAYPQHSGDQHNTSQLNA